VNKLCDDKDKKKENQSKENQTLFFFSLSALFDPLYLSLVY
jgi:hypothetical protein